MLLSKLMSNFKQGVNSLQTYTDLEAVGALLQAHVNSLRIQMQTRKKLELLFKHVSNFKQGVTSLQTDAGSEAVGASLKIDRHLLAGVNSL